MTSDLYERILEKITAIEVIDGHEHLWPENVRVETQVDVFTLFSQYIQFDLMSAGLSEADLNKIFDRSLPLQSRWKMAAPYWESVRHTSYARAALLAVKKFYGFDDINDGTYEAISEAIAASNKHGLYDKVLRQACNIRTCLTQCGTTDTGSELLTPLMPLIYFNPMGELETPDRLVGHPFSAERNIKTLDDLVSAIDDYAADVKAKGAVGLKMAAVPFGEPNRAQAEAMFDHIMGGGEPPWPSVPSGHDYLGRHYSNPLRDYYVDCAIASAGRHGLVVAVHTGYWWDFRRLNPLNMIPILYRHPDVKFDIYHLGYPWVRETLLLGKNFPNAFLNLCWLHVISEKCGRDALREAFDLVPINKITGFGGDYGIPVEKVYGHLTIARENIASVLAEKMKACRIDEDEAIDIAKCWLWENPRRLYGLNL